MSTQSASLSAQESLKHGLLVFSLSLPSTQKLSGKVEIFYFRKTILIQNLQKVYFPDLFH
jgi:hypothetical protein